MSAAAWGSPAGERLPPEAMSSCSGATGPAIPTAQPSFNPGRDCSKGERSRFLKMLTSPSVRATARGEGDWKAARHVIPCFSAGAGVRGQGLRWGHTVSLLQCSVLIYLLRTCPHVGSEGEGGPGSEMQQAQANETHSRTATVPCHRPAPARPRTPCPKRGRIRPGRPRISAGSVHPAAHSGQPGAGGGPAGAAGRRGLRFGPAVRTRAARLLGGQEKPRSHHDHDYPVPA